MAVPELKGDHLKMVPNFGGEVELLSEFISVSEALVNHFYDAVNPGNFQNVYLMNSLRSKIVGEAKVNLSTYTITTWNDLKRALLTTYGDKRDCYTLAFEMCNIKQYYTESPFEFHTRVQKFVNLHSSYMDTHEMGNQNHVKDYVAKLGLRTLLRGLNEPLGNLMRTKNPKDLNEALNMMTNDFQIDVTKKPSGQSNNNQKQNSRNFSKATGPRYVPPPMKNSNYPSTSDNYQRNVTANQGNPNQFRSFSQNTQIRPSTSYNNNLSNQSNVFGRQNNFSKPLPKPTPMSIVQSRNSNLHNIEELTTTENDIQDFSDNSLDNAENYYNVPDGTDENSDQDFRLTASEQE